VAFLFLGQEGNVQLHPESWDSLLQGLRATTSPILADSNPKGRFRPKRTEAAFLFLYLKIERHPTLYTSKRSRKGGDFPWLTYVCVERYAMPREPPHSGSPGITGPSCGYESMAALFARAGI
jgi:hypothetical protein